MLINKKGAITLMNLRTKRIRGMQDVLPSESKKWQTIEKVMTEEASLHGFKLIRTPVLEHTELFERSVGDTSDVVEKEMYTFKDKGDRSVTLRPEGTAGTLRAVLENGLHNLPMPLKLMYKSSCYRYEKPQTGRYREFFQFGLEIFGSPSASADAELIILAKAILERLQIQNISLEINSIGCKNCRKKYSEAIINYFKSKIDSLCPTCQNRLEKNPLRILDCKNKVCSEICENAPIITDYICEECSEHFETLQEYLKSQNIEFKINPKIVRGLDYYSKTVFEFVCDITENDKLTICGGGRYDGLSEILGGPQLCAIGLGFGLERILNIMETQKIMFPKDDSPKVYIASIGENAKKKAFELCGILRTAAIFAEMDIVDRNIKSQMKYADKIGAEYVLVIGDDEIAENRAILKNMKTGKESKISINEDFLNDFSGVDMDNFKF